MDAFEFAELRGALYAEMLEAMQHFVERVDRGEVRSITTYRQFQGFLARARTIQRRDPTLSVIDGALERMDDRPLPLKSDSPQSGESESKEAGWSDLPKAGELPPWAYSF